MPRRRGQEGFPIARTVFEQGHQVTVDISVDVDGQAGEEVEDGGEGDRVDVRVVVDAVRTEALGGKDDGSTGTGGGGEGG
jgi:hypothetical protein